MKNTKLLFIALILFLNTSLFAIKQENINVQMQEKISTVLEILNNKEIQQEQKTQKIFTLLESIFDFKIMSLISLGKKYKTLNKAQKADFIKAFELKLKESFKSKLKLYTNQDMIVEKSIKLKKNRIKLLTKLVNKTNTYTIVYKFHKIKNQDSWFIYDVVIEDVSILSAYRKQFSSFLKNDSIENLIKKLYEKDIKK